jgi:hypothetical protein
MPAIQSELRIQVEGGRVPLLIKRTPLQVSSCETFSFQVDGVPPAKAKKAKKNAANRKKADTRTVQMTFRPKLSNVKFVAIYDGGQGNGLNVKVGSGKMAPVSDPIVLTGNAARAFGNTPVIVVENASPSARTVMMLVGSDLAKTARRSKVVTKRGAAVAKGKPR